jgi:hypothetical protein
MRSDRSNAERPLRPSKPDLAPVSLNFCLTTRSGSDALGGPTYPPLPCIARASRRRRLVKSYGVKRVLFLLSRAWLRSDWRWMLACWRSSQDSLARARSGVLDLSSRATKPRDLSAIERPILKLFRDELDRLPYIVVRDKFSSVAPDGFEPAPAGGGNFDGNCIHVFDVAHQRRLIGTRHEPYGFARHRPEAISLLGANTRQGYENACEYPVVGPRRRTADLAPENADALLDRYPVDRGAYENSAVA